MNDPIRVGGDDVVHEVEELDAPAADMQGQAGADAMSTCKDDCTAAWPPLMFPVMETSFGTGLPRLAACRLGCRRGSKLSEQRSPAPTVPAITARAAPLRLSGCPPS